MHLHKVEWGSMSSNTIISIGVDGFQKPITIAPEHKHMRQGIDFLAGRVRMRVSLNCNGKSM